MKTITDSAYTIGSSHTVCQDYALDSQNFDKSEESIYVCLSDGCSSSQNSDIGARLNCLSHTTDQEYKSILADILCLDYSKIDATDLQAYLTEHNILYKIIGDGFIVEECNDYLTVYKIEFEEGYPYYLSYHFDNNRRKKLFEETTITRIITKEKISLNTFEIQPLETKTEYITYEPNELKYIYNINTPIKGDLKSISLFSDGLASFIDKDKNPIDIYDIIKKIYPINNPNSGTIKRIIHNRIKKICLKENISHYDDLSMASIFFIQEENDNESSC